jgi:hypothetical protein
MILGGLVAAFLGVAAEAKSLEDVAISLSVIRKPPPTPVGSGGPPRPATGNIAPAWSAT